jgi:hypothetical protein
MKTNFNRSLKLPIILFWLLILVAHTSKNSLMILNHYKRSVC